MLQTQLAAHKESCQAAELVCELCGQVMLGH
jgi:hypothetical protein